MGQTRRTYTREFKAEAVKLITERGRSVAEAARALGIRANLLRNWERALQGDGGPALPGRGTPPALGDALRRLRAENQRLLMERDILKKAAAFFAQESL